jgi:hypothetical protein
VIWQNPWAWLGLMMLGVPLLIHLLGRRRARVQPFPTLRFLDASRQQPVRRTRIEDALLLAVRMGVIGAAVAALAQPLMLTAGRERALGATLVRAIVVDTSSSMQRDANGERGVDAARREARRIADGSAASVVVETALPSRALAGAASWLDSRSGRREIVVVSDFQSGAIDAADIYAIPDDIGVDFVRIDVASPTTIEAVSTSGTADVIARVELVDSVTTIEWSVANVRDRADSSAVRILAGPQERQRADAAYDAAFAAGAPTPRSSERPVAIIFAHYPDRARLLAAAQPLHQPWMAEVVAAVRSDPELTAASVDAGAGDDMSADPARATGDASGAGTPTPFTAAALTRSGNVIATAASGPIAGRDHLLFFAAIDAGSLASALLISSIARALSPASPVGEMEPAGVAAQVLESWTRPPATSVAARADAGASDGRWMWIVALLLLALETLMRRIGQRARALEHR